MSDSSNPPLSPWVRLLFLLVALVLCVGAGLLIAPVLVMPRWLWQLTPFNARFMGAIYLTELSVVLPFLYYNRRSPGRVVLPSALTFVALISLLTVVYLDHFDLQRPATYAWFVIYLVPTLLLTILIGVYRPLFATGAHPLPHRWPVLIRIEALLLMIYGLGLVAAPALFSSFWPWSIDTFHARIYSAFFITLAVGAFVLGRGVEKLDVLTLGIGQTVTGVAVIGGFIATDLMVHRVNWLAGGTWLWIAIFVAIGLMGVLLMGISRQRFEEIGG